MNKKFLLKKQSFTCFKKRKKALEEAIDNKNNILVFDDGLQEAKIDFDIEYLNITEIKNGLEIVFCCQQDLLERNLEVYLSTMRHL